MEKFKRTLQIIIPITLIIIGITTLGNIGNYENSEHASDIVLISLFTVSGSIVFLLTKNTSMLNSIDPIGYVHIKFLTPIANNTISHISQTLSFDEKWSLVTSYIMPICEGLNDLRYMIENDKEHCYLELEIDKINRNSIRRVTLIGKQEFKENFVSNQEFSDLETKLQNIINTNYK